MGKKTFVIDTNVLLYDPSSLKKFQDNDVIIPLTVLEELDAIKRNSNEIGKNAREVMRFIDSLTFPKNEAFEKGVKLKEGPTIKIFLQSKGMKLEGFPLIADRNANKILLAAFIISKQCEKVVFLSKDFISRVKAEAMGLETEDYEALKVSTKEMFSGIKKIKVEKSKIDQFYKQEYLEGIGQEFRPNEFCILHSEENSSAVCKYNIDNKRLEPLFQAKEDIWGIHPLNVEQKCAMDLLLRNDIPLVTLIGPAGTGKTLIALACAMHKVFDGNDYSRILVSRPVIPLGKDIGFLPGTKEEKLFHWMQPIYDNLEFLCEKSNGEGNGKDALNWIMESNKIEMEAVTYIRGRTLPKMFIIIDEAQNLTPHEVKTIISRAGKGTKVILTGDPSQIDNPYLDENSNGLSFTASRFKDQKLYGHVYLNKTERSDLAAVAAELM